MKYMTSNQIRNTWLQFFKSKGHHVEESASLIPVNDPTLLWINAGVAALKKYFDGTITPQNPRICNVQKAIRTNDIENVGFTARHHTFFEMMGNFSIGDYFRNEVIEYAYELLFSEEYFGFDQEKIYITYHPSDKATYQKWIEVGIEPSHLIANENNFWEIGEGPCGPDTEMFYDRGEIYDPQHLGLKLIQEDIENDRYIEIWNIVFSQFNAKKGLTRDQYEELPHKNIDTGAGLERFACILQQTKTNYETDLFLPIINKCEQLGKEKYDSIYHSSFKIIADHLRTCTFALVDGASFSNEGRGYVLRRLLRRAVRHGNKIGIEGPFLAQLVDTVIEIMQDFYPYLLQKKDYIKDLITKEEIKFNQTLKDGEKKLEELYVKKKAISGEDAFILYDTYGFPFELTQEYASEKGLQIDYEEFKKAMEKQKEMARDHRNVQSSMNVQNASYLSFKENSEFIGYRYFNTRAKVIAIFNENPLQVVFDKTPFYAEMGGEIADSGKVENDTFLGKVVQVLKMPNGQHLHQIEGLKGELNKDDIVFLSVDEKKRMAIEKNHSATHLMHQALKDVLGSHVNQQGSFVSDENLRFDFNHFKNITADELLQIETIVNQKIQDQIPVQVYHLSLTQAKKEGITALFNEKYGEEVRVVDMHYSKELCGGCHVKNTGDIQHFSIVSLESKGSGIYRIEAVTGKQIIEKIKKMQAPLVQEYEMGVEKISTLIQENDLKNFNLSKVEEVPSYQLILNYKKAVLENKEILKNIDKKLKDLQHQQIVKSLFQEENEVILVKNKKLLLKTINLDDMQLLKVVADTLFERYPETIIFVMSCLEDKTFFVAKAPQKYVQDGVHCGKLVQSVATLCDGKGGGRPDMAQAGGKKLENIPLVLEKIEECLQ